MRQARAGRIELLNKLRNKLKEIKEAGKSGVISLNVPKLKRPKMIKQKSVLEVLKTPRSPKEKESSMKEGTVKWFNINRGYGFIVGEDKKEYFAHHGNIMGKTTERSLTEGDKVRFQSKNTDKGLSAIKVIKQDERK